jgi:hypothetical protein
MAETSKGGKQLEWACRILMTADIIVIISGYLIWFQTKRQLVSPLIPRSTVYEIFSDSSDSYFKASLVAAAMFITGLWFWSFKKKIAAIIIFSAVILLLPFREFFFRM